MAEIVLVLEVPDEDHDPTDGTGLTQDAYEELMRQLPYDVTSGPTVRMRS